MSPMLIAAICAGVVAACTVATLLGRYFAGKGFPLVDENRLGCVDGLRGYLATFVMLYHFILYVQVTRLGGVWSRPSLGFFDSLGPGSVNLFFMTTGFLFYPRILKGFGAVDWGKLYISRVFRIVPLVVFLVGAASFIILTRLHFRPNAPFGTTAAAMARWIICWDQPDLFGYRNSGQLGSVMWSLWFEWLFYIFVLPACALSMSLRGRLPTWTVPATMIVVASALKPLHLMPLIDFLPLFGVGMLAFEVRSRPALASRLQTPLASALALSCLLGGAVLFSGAARVLLHSAFFVCVASGCSLWGLLKTRAARVLGDVSYGIYLLHMLVLNVLFVTFGGIVARIGTAELAALMPLVAIVGVSAASLSYLLLERPAIGFGKNVRPWLHMIVHHRRTLMGGAELDHQRG